MSQPLSDFADLGDATELAKVGADPRAARHLSLKAVLTASGRCSPKKSPALAIIFALLLLLGFGECRRLANELLRGVYGTTAGRPASRL